MRVLNITYDDYANFQHDNANALRSVGVYCEDVKLVKHVYNYETESVVLSQKEIIDKIKDFDLIQIFHSCTTSLTLFNKCNERNKRLVVYHTGTRYRQNPFRYNKIFNPLVERSFIALPEFHGLGSYNETYIVGAIDTDKILPKINGNKKFRLAHYPSNPKVKGTEIINKVVSGLSKFHYFDYLHSVENVGYKEQLQRINECHTYVELFAPLQDGKVYGSWGITCLEAACMNKHIVTQNLNDAVYRNAYGSHPLLLCKTEDELADNILNSMILIPETRDWVVKNHSYKATGERLKQILKL